MSCKYAIGCAEEIWLPYSANFGWEKLGLVRPTWNNLNKLIVGFSGER